MRENTIDIGNGEINVEEIMANIRANIRRRQENGELPCTSEIQSPISYHDTTGISGNFDSVKQDLECISSNGDIYNTSYFITSHRPHLGKLLVKGRQLVNGEVRRYVDPMISRQVEFNTTAARILSKISQQCNNLDIKVSDLGENFSQKLTQEKEELSQKLTQEKEELSQKLTQEKEELSQKLTQEKEELSQRITREQIEITESVQKKIDSSVQNVFSEFDKNLGIQIGLVKSLENRMHRGISQNDVPTIPIEILNLNYVQFEDRFRGSRIEIKQRQKEFLLYFEKCTHVLDIGCGRGEFLELLAEHKIGGIGVDIDEDMVAYCKSKQLNAELGDAGSYLEKLDDNSLDGIFIDQVIEHLEPAYLIRLLALCHQKLKTGYYIVVETVNPLSFVSFVNFYIDLSHVRPVHPETLQYLISAAGFSECEKKFLSLPPEDLRLKKMIAPSQSNEEEQTRIEIYNHNIEILNTILFGAQDYVIIGKK
jgi:O-antigen chain-terminating methyltransferase